MNIIVCIKQVPETNKVEVDPVTGVLKREGIDCKMNPYDLYALEVALCLKEKHGGCVTAITMGPPQAEEILREAYSMGADHAVLISDRRFAGSDVLATSYTLAQCVQKIGDFDLVLCGKQTTDGDTAQVGSEMGEFLGIPSAAAVTKISEVSPDAITVEMDMPSTVETVCVRFPCLLCVENSICEPRLPSYKKKMATKDRKIEILSLDDFSDKDESKYGLDGSPTQVQRIFPPEDNTGREIWKGSGDALSQKLYDALLTLKFI